MKDNEGEVVQNHRGSYLLEVIVTRVLEGEGKEPNPYRIVNYFHDKNGNLLAFNDTMDDSVSKKQNRWIDVCRPTPREG